MSKAGENDHRAGREQAEENKAEHPRATGSIHGRRAFLADNAGIAEERVINLQAARMANHSPEHRPTIRPICTKALSAESSM